jgi:CxxC motif-containing protein
MVSVKTAEDVPRDCVLGVIDALRDVSVEAPVCIGDVIVPNVCGTGVNVVATKNC